MVIPPHCVSLTTSLPFFSLLLVLYVLDHSVLSLFAVTGR